MPLRENFIERAFVVAGCTSVRIPVDQAPRPGTGEPATSYPTPELLANTGVPSNHTPTTSPDLFLPSDLDPTARYLFYLHGKIVEDQGLPAVSPEYGEYKHLEILNALQGFGFVAVSEQRPKDTDVAWYASRVAGQVAALPRSLVPAGSITIVGASKGAVIAVAVSDLLQNQGVNYVLLGSCHPSTIAGWKQQGISLSGNVLAVYDHADEYAGSCDQLFGSSEANGLGRHEEIMLRLGTGHGILYQPLQEWILPTVRWANQEY